MKHSWIVLVVIVLIGDVYSQDENQWMKLTKNSEEYQGIGEHFHLNSVDSPIFGGRMVGGMKADISDHPHHVLLILTDSIGNNSYCGGAIINANWILSAAHCTFNQKFITVVAGMSDASKLYDVWIFRNISTRNFVSHKEFELKTFKNDISLVRLEIPLPSTKTISVISLPSVDFDNESMVGKKVTLSGFGRFADADPFLSTILKSETFLIIDLNECKKVFFKNSVTDAQLCVKAELTSSPCMGDSGGGLVLNEKKPILVGIVSFGATVCQGGYPVVFTKVSSYLNWIAEITKIENII
ncbi:unnamed protein product [Diamesa serratosioi]